MTSPLLDGNWELQRSLTATLGESPQVSRYDELGWSEAEVLVHALADLEGSFRTYLDHHLPRLIEARDGEAVHEVLEEIGNEIFRHVLYHISDPKFFDYLPSTDELKRARHDR